MANHKIGELRRSNLISTYGPGAIADFRTPDGGVISVVIAGLNYWDTYSPEGKGLSHSQVISEPRLQANLNLNRTYPKIEGFRLPPVEAETLFKKVGKRNNFVPSFRFPEWLQCPHCHVIGHEESWGSDISNDLGRYCTDCSSSIKGGKKVYCVPIRFIMACPAGHLQDFPWHQWVGHKSDCRNRSQHHQLKLESRGPGLANLYVSCDSCKSESNLKGIFSREFIKKRGVTCNGSSPWLGPSQKSSECKEEPRVVQRGASNLYFPLIETALSIPPFADGLIEELGPSYTVLKNVIDLGFETFTAVCLAQPTVQAILTSRGWTPQDLYDAFTYQQEFVGASQGDLKKDEYRMLLQKDSDNRDFKTRRIFVPSILISHFKNLVLLDRLREVRALKGFTRITSPDPETGSGRLARISAGLQEWLPAIENKGEGFFLTLSPDRLERWENQAEVQERAAIINKAFKKNQDDLDIQDPKKYTITPRFLLLHTFAHALMRQLASECGYSASSIRERLYVGEGETGMAGVLIYTAAPDADGTLGGLVRQASSERIQDWLPRAIQEIQWCASDPLCITASIEQMVRETQNLAACHACVLAPETSCTEFNRFLDRAMLVGLPNQPEIGFFSDLLKL